MPSGEVLASAAPMVGTGGMCLGIIPASRVTISETFARTSVVADRNNGATAETSVRNNAAIVAIFVKGVATADRSRAKKTG